MYSAIRLIAIWMSSRNIRNCLCIGANSDNIGRAVHSLDKDSDYVRLLPEYTHKISTINYVKELSLLSVLQNSTWH